MKKNKLLQLSLASFAALAISPVGGVATAQEDYHHWHHHDHWACYDLMLDNTNNLNVVSDATQNSTSGEVTISGNGTVGDVGSGSTSNSRTSDVAIDIDNSTLVNNLPDPVAPMNNHHHHGHGLDMDIDNINTIEITNTVQQTATSGAVTVTGNTTVGDVSSGSSSNTSSSTISISTL